MPEEIGLIPTDDLIKELEKRFEHMIFAGIRVGYESSERTRTKRYFNGNYATCSGLCSLLQGMIWEALEDADE